MGKKKYRIKMYRSGFKLQQRARFFSIEYWITIFESDNLDSIAKAIDLVQKGTDEILF